MVHYKLCYFGTRGRAEGIRFILAQSGVDFEDEKISKEEWETRKQSTPMGQLPILYVDKKVLGQSMAIARYLAKEHGLMPSNHFMAAKADMLVDGLGDELPHLTSYLMATFKGDADEAARQWLSYKKEHMPVFLDLYEKLLTENGGKYFVGDHMTWADLMIAELLDRMTLFNDNNISFVDGHKHLSQFLKRILSLPNLKTYLAKRSETAV